MCTFFLFVLWFSSLKVEFINFVATTFQLSLIKSHCVGIQSPPSGEEKSSKFSITSTELYNFIHGKKPCSTLILDIRLKEDFEESSMMVKDVVNIPEEIISPRYLIFFLTVIIVVWCIYCFERNIFHFVCSNIASKLESLIEPRFRPFFSRRGEYDRVIVVDWSSKSYTNSSSKVLTMLKVLKQVSYKCSCVQKSLLYCNFFTFTKYYFTLLKRPKCPIPRLEILFLNEC